MKTESVVIVETFVGSYETTRSGSPETRSVSLRRWGYLLDSFT